MGLTFTHHRDFVDQGYNPLAGPLGGGAEKYGIKCAFLWDTTKLDGSPVYYYEFTVDNPSADAGRVALGRIDSWVTEPSVTELTGSSISIPGSTGPTRYRVGPVTIPAGNFYAPIGSLLIPVVENPGTVTGAGMTMYSGRLVITQTDATKTRVWRPLVNGPEGSGDCYYCQSDLLLGAVGVPVFPSNSGFWRRLDSDFIAATRSYMIQSNISGTGSGTLSTTFGFGLYNATALQRIMNSYATRVPPGYFSEPQFDWWNVAFSADSQFLNNTDIQWFWEQLEPVLLGTGKLYGAGLYIDLTGIEKITTWARVSKGTGTSTGGFAETVHTARVLGADFSGATALFTEISGQVETAAVVGKVQLQSAGTSDSAQTGSDIAGTQVNISSVNRQAIRSSPFSPALISATTRVIARSSLASGSGDDVREDWILLGATWETAAVCNGVSADINTSTLLVTGTGTGTGVAWRVVRTSDSAVMASGSGTSASFSFTGAYGVTYQLQFQSAGGTWSSAGCLFSFAGESGSCLGVLASIDGLLVISGTGTGIGTEWRVVRTSDSAVMDTGVGASASFSFPGALDVTYQLQFKGTDGIFSTTGCTFSFGVAALTCPPSGTITVVCKQGIPEVVCKTGTIVCCVPE
jgi:hypothetical protein